MSDAALGKGQDVAFGFDPRPFINGIRQANASMSSMLTATKNVANQMATRLIALKVGFMAVKHVIQNVAAQIPEIGQAFAIAKDIFLKNLLWPLRQMLMPMLQKMLNWVRDHRTLFVKWGQSLANVFKILLVIGKQVWDVFVRVASAFRNLFGQMTGGGFADFLNLMSVKLAALTIFLGSLFKTILGGLNFGRIIGDLRELVSMIWSFVSGLFKANEQGDSFWTLLGKISKLAGDVIHFVLELAKAFGEGLFNGLKGIMTPLSGIVDELARLFEVVKGGNNGQFLKTLAEGLGLIVGGTIMTGLFAIWGVLEGIVDAVKIVIASFQVLADVWSGKASDMARSNLLKVLAESGSGFARIGAMAKNYYGGQIQNWEELTKPKVSGEVHDAIITKKGEIVKIDPNDTITASKRPGGMMGIGAQTFNINLMVTEGSARVAGENFAYGAQQGFRRAILDAHIAGGG
jgi:hypothetical protein